MKSRVILSGLTAMFFAVAVNADGVSIDPGEWEMTTTLTMSMMPQPQTTTIKECIEENELNPEDFNMDEENPCAISNVDINGGTARWSISCPTDNGTAMEGTWEFTSEGDTLSGNGSMSANFGGQDMSFEMTWEGMRIGDCK